MGGWIFQVQNNCNVSKSSLWVLPSSSPLSIWSTYGRICPLTGQVVFMWTVTGEWMACVAVNTCWLDIGLSCCAIVRRPSHSTVKVSHIEHSFLEVFAFRQSDSLIKCFQTIFLSGSLGKVLNLSFQIWHIMYDLICTVYWFNSWYSIIIERVDANLAMKFPAFVRSSVNVFTKACRWTVEFCPHYLSLRYILI